jgi:hypothetical protein
MDIDFDIPVRAFADHSYHGINKQSCVCVHQRMNIATEDLDRYMDLRPFMNPAPYSVYDVSCSPLFLSLLSSINC